MIEIKFISDMPTMVIESDEVVQMWSVSSYLILRAAAFDSSSIRRLQHGRLGIEILTRPILVLDCKIDHGRDISLYSGFLITTTTIMTVFSCPSGDRTPAFGFRSPPPALSLSVTATAIQA